MALYTFQPLYKSRIWGGRNLEELFGRNISTKEKIGESWELVDREEDQSICIETARPLHELWISPERVKIFGTHAPSMAKRFPILIKILDATEKLSLQVHPPACVASQLGGEPKNEIWYFLNTKPEAEIYAGFKQPVSHGLFDKISSFLGLQRPYSRKQFERMVADGTAQECIHQITTNPFHAIYIPSGRIHGIGAGNVVLEVQQNSDTTFRVYDYNRLDNDGRKRELHVKEALQCINFGDFEPQWIQPHGDRLLCTDFFEVYHHFFLEKESRLFPIASTSFEYFFIASGLFHFAEKTWPEGSSVLVSANHGSLDVTCASNNGVLVRVRFP